MGGPSIDMFGATDDCTIWVPDDIYIYIYTWIFPDRSGQSESTCHVMFYVVSHEKGASLEERLDYYI